MNNIKRCLLLISFSACSMLTAQDEVTAPTMDRVIIFQANQAIVAVLDNEGFVKRKIMDLPDYFIENHSDKFYIEASYISLSDAQLKKELIDNSHHQLETLASTQLRPSKNQ